MPSGPPVTTREFAERLCALAGAPAPRLRRVPGWAVKAAGLAVPFLRELEEIRYQFDRPFVLGSPATEAALGLAPTPFDDALRTTIAWWRGR